MQAHLARSTYLDRGLSMVAPVQSAPQVTVIVTVRTVGPSKLRAVIGSV